MPKLVQERRPTRERKAPARLTDATDRCTKVSPKEKKVKAARIPTKFNVGEKVDANYRGWKKYYAGTITKVSSRDAYDILYDDGDAESNVPWKRIKKRANEVDTYQAGLSEEESASDWDTKPRAKEQASEAAPSEDELESDWETTKPAAKKPDAKKRTSAKNASAKNPAAKKPAGKKPAGKKPAPSGSALTVGQLAATKASQVPARWLAPRGQATAPARARDQSASSPARRPARARATANPRSPAKRLRRLVGDIASAVGRATGLSPSVPKVVRTSPGSNSGGSTITGTTAGTDASNLNGEPNTGKEIEEFFLQDYNEKGDGGDSDVEGDLINVHHESLLRNEGQEVLLRDEANDIDAEEEGVVGNCIPGAPEGWDPPSAPWDYEPAPPKFDAPECFEDVDNPGGWSPFTFRARYSNNKYVGHFTPSGAQVVPENAEGKRVVTNEDGEEWEFFYDGWTPSDFDNATYVRGGAKKGNLNPKSRKGRLDAKVLKKHGLNEARMEGKDAFFFFQLLFPVCNPAESTVKDDDRIPFFTHARACSNIYAVGEKNWGGGVGHVFKLFTEAELVHKTGVEIRHGAREGRPGSLHQRWSAEDPNYDALIAENVSISRFRQIKACYKLNNNFFSGKRGDDEFDPCDKYDHIIKALCHNMNYVTEYADLDYAIDETTWGFSGYSGECGGRLRNKPVGKGTHVLLLLDFCQIDQLVLLTNLLLLIQVVRQR